MKQAVRRRFEFIARNVITQMEAVECDREDFIEGLEIVESAVAERREFG